MVRWDNMSPYVRIAYEMLKKKLVTVSNSISVLESQHWIKFKSSHSRRAFATLNPQRNQIRVFISIDPTHFDDPRRITRTSSSTGLWGKNFPIEFRIYDSEDVDYAMKLLMQAYDFTLQFK
jgi:predicted transport protein